jgi:hypothetical protein
VICGPLIVLANPIVLRLCVDPVVWTIVGVSLGAEILVSVRMIRRMRPASGR